MAQIHHRELTTPNRRRSLPRYNTASGLRSEGDRIKAGRRADGGVLVNPLSATSLSDVDDNNDPCRIIWYGHYFGQAVAETRLDIIAVP